jgi:hypothetical protein
VATVIEFPGWVVVIEQALFVASILLKMAQYHRLLAGS